MAKKRESRTARSSATPRNSRIDTQQQTEIQPEVGEYDMNKSRIDGNTVISVAQFDDRINFNKYPRYLQNIEKKIRNRMFVEGKNSADSKTKKAKSYNKKYFRFFTGKLFRSFYVKAEKGIIIIRLRRSKEIIQHLEKLYGIYFKISPSDLAFINEQINKIAKLEDLNNVIKADVIV